MTSLQSIDRVSEVLFGLIMVLTFTGTLSVASAGQEDVRTMLIGALGCNVAWGLIDAVFYLMGALAEKGKNLETYRAVRSTNDPQQAQRLIAGALPPIVASVLEPKELEALRDRLKRLSEPPERASLSKDDWLEAGHVFVLVFLSTVPVTLPFLVISDAELALRISNGIAILLLFVAGHKFGRITGRRPLYVGISMVILGLALVGMTIALGG